MTRLVGIDIRGAVKTLRGLSVIPHTTMQIEKLEQSLGVVPFPVGGIEQLAQELQKFGRTSMFADDVLHHRDKGAAISPAALELLQLARQRYRFGILLGIHQQPNEIRKLLQPCWILLEELPK